ncbi:protein serine/threonine phosphatase [Chloroherpeton thalassium ATCC 35110]|uniref:Protein serine/threonine phosphatase n=1 Tax=Chloroherpeton thalassium (strain ATCC 35110 / GB-78) TaxID=517418 RepID=B3QTF1_CHLT3|nr:SpoIIE family protein phosphatase [Chloroherpeton thalassium]ACF12697.1 protein serine/threonine phosphatase [Chloroherpeton thalassium ATCC 35110]
MPEDDSLHAQSLERIKPQDFDYNSLLESSKILNSSLDLEFILSHILRTVMGKFMLLKACIITFSESDQSVFELAASRGLHGAKKQFTNLELFQQQHDIHALIDLSIGNKRIGYIGLSDKFNRQPFKSAESEFLESLASLAASAIENALFLNQLNEQKAHLKQVNESLQQKILQFNTLFELTQRYRVDQTKEDILQILMHALMLQMNFKSYVVLLRNEMNFDVAMAKDIKSDHLEAKEIGIIFSSSFAHELKWEEFPSITAAGCYHAIPLRTTSTSLGVILFGERRTEEPFTETDYEFMFLAAAQAAGAIEQVRLFKDALEKQAIEKELALAYEIQTNLFPKSLPKSSIYEIDATNFPSLHVGGDYYDVFEVDDRLLFLAIADVTGKGVPASLIMSNLQALIKAYIEMVRAGAMSINDMVGKINDIIYGNTTIDKFISFFCCLIDKEKLSLTYINAGHNPPILLRTDGSLSQLQTGGIVLGVLPSTSPYESETLALQKGDMLFLYTDGVTEAMSKEHEEFGENRLIQILKNAQGNSCPSILSEVTRAIDNFEPPGEHHDDVTMICFKVTP